ncbi:MAG: DUF2232 domain-containing protein [Gammaproteobacteria bacterium]|nr:DUF2232 domain-containing protein [Gammaproteobacteria bacterium]
MRAIAQLIMRSAAHAGGVAAVTGLTGLILPPLVMVSGAAVALYTLRRGARAGMQAIVVAILVLGIVALLGGGLMPFAALPVGTWLPAWLLALVLRSTASQSWMVVAAGLLGVIYLVTSQLVLGDPVNWWQTWLTGMVNELAAQNPEFNVSTVKVEVIASQMQSLLATAIVSTQTLTMLLARWWQSQLFNPGGFRAEFVAMRLPRIVLQGVAVLAVILWVIWHGDARSEVLAGYALVLVVMFSITGLALTHWTIGHQQWSVWWLVVAYVVFLRLPAIAALVGVVDTVFDLRKVLVRRQ